MRATMQQHRSAERLPLLPRLRSAGASIATLVVASLAIGMTPQLALAQTKPAKESKDAKDAKDA